MANRRKIPYCFTPITSVFVATVLAACGGGSGGGVDPIPAPNPVPGPPLEDPPLPGPVDTDGDGLSDTEEAFYGTSVRQADTDGDGFSDFQEVINFGFNPNNNNFRFNPLIADVPKLRVEITSVPDVSLNYTTTTGSAETISTERSTESSRTVTTSETSSNSRAVEQTHSAGVTVGGTVSALGPSASASVSYDYSHSTTNESSFSQTDEQSAENSEALSEGESFEQSNEIATSSGELALSLKVTNDSNLSFRLDSLLLGSVMVDPLNRSAVVPVANLELDTQFGSFQPITLAPGAETGDLVFNNSELSIDTTKTLLRDATGLIINVAANEVVDADGVAFAFRQTDIEAKTATVLIDYGVLNRPSERYLVATNANMETGRVSFSSVMADILRVPYTVDENGSLDSIRALTANAALDSYWVAVQVTDDGNELTADTLNPADSAYVFNTRELRAGDVLQLVYVEDADGDGVGLRDEFFIGTDPNNPDTDGDLLSDGQELNGFELTVDYGDGEGSTLQTVRSSPIKSDTDDDGVSDFEELSGGTGPWITDPRAADTDGDQIDDIYDPTPTLFTNIALDTELVIAQDAAGASSGTYTPGGNTPTFVLNSPVISGADVEYLFFRERVGLQENFCPNQLCYEQASLTSAFGTTQASLSTTGWILQDDEFASPDSKYRYQIFVRVNDSQPILLDEASIDTAVATQSLTVHISQINVPVCIDREYRPILGFGDPNINLVCELFWSISINGITYDGRNGDQLGRSEQNAESVQDLDLINVDQAKVIEVPIEADGCFEIVFQPYEHEGTDLTTLTGDDRLGPRAREHCQADNWDVGVEQRLAPSVFFREEIANSQIQLEHIEAELFYTVNFTQ